MDDVTRRLDRLESTARRWRWAAVGLGGCLVGLVAFGAAPNSPEQVEAKRFVVLGDDGKPRAEFGLGKYPQPRIVLYDDMGNERLHLGLSTAKGDNDAPHLVMIDGKKTVRLEIDLTAEGLPTLRMADRDLKTRAQVRVDGSDAGVVEVLDGEENVTATLGATRAARPGRRR